MEIQVHCGFTAQIDDADFDIIRGYRWIRVGGRPRSPWYAVTYVYANGGHTAILMHRLILGLDDPAIFVDHINHDTLDNRRANLRQCSRAENSRNREMHINNKAGVKGVYAEGDKWRAQIRCEGKKYDLGRFDSIEGAARAYQAASVRLHGEFALRR